MNDFYVANNVLLQLSKPLNANQKNYYTFFIQVTYNSVPALFFIQPSPNNTALLYVDLYVTQNIQVIFINDFSPFMSNLLNFFMHTLLKI